MNHLGVSQTSRSWLLAVLALIASAIAVSCAANEATTTQESASLPISDSTAVNEDIPVEALPDPLPAPYLFRDEVTIERAPITETIYVVQPGDTMASIATQFCLTTEEIQRLNNIVDINALDIGQELRIPIREGGCGVAAPTSTDPEEAEPAQPQRLPGEIYIVQEGDTLAEIAAAYGYTWVDIMSYNGLTEAQAASLQIGQALIIPPPPETPEEQPEQEEPSEPPG